VNIVESVRKLGLPEKQFVVMGSGTLAILGIISQASDIDLAVSPELFAFLKRSGWKPPAKKETKAILEMGEFEAGIGYGDWSLGELLDDAIFIDGVPFASLEKIKAWKKAAGREKDAAHIAAIEEYQRTHSVTNTK
jgi:hypothetical protein